VTSLLNSSRPPVFCPGCAHDRIVHGLDKAFLNMDLKAEEIVIVSDIGCSGLFDTFFNTHAFHGLHGRALTYATGIKMARPDLNVVVTMGDGGLGIGGAHVLSTCRRNIDLTLLVLNNFNYGMTGGQCSSTTPGDAQVGSGFLNRLEKPLDICQVAGTAGAGFVERASSYQKDLAERLEAAIRFDGFSLMDLWGVCPGRYTKRNRLTPKVIESQLAELPPVDGFIQANQRKEYGRHYREIASELPPVPQPSGIEKITAAPQSGRQEVMVLGSAGQRILTAGELLCLAGHVGGLRATQKNDYPITVLRGHSVTEVVLDNEPVSYSGIEKPAVILALAPEGVERRKAMLKNLTGSPLIIRAAGVELPPCDAAIVTVDFKAQKIKSPDWALAGLAVLAKMNRVINLDMLKQALSVKFKKGVLDSALELVDKVAINVTVSE
jgi:2-oxoglutarate/2-oxoacid ferredoxin oxidoreductase subunit beta